MKVLTIGYGRNLFDDKNSERARLAACALVVDALHMIVFSQKKHGCAPAEAGALYLHPTNSRSQAGMLYDAYKIGSALLRVACAKKEKNNCKNEWTISAQDPFETGLVGYLLHLRYGIPLQVQEHGDFFGSTWWRKERWSNEVRFVFGKWLLRRADSVRAASSRVAHHLVALGVDPRKITTLAITGDMTAFTKKDVIADARNLRAQYPSAKAIILAVGRLVKEKNFELFIRAFRKISAQHPIARLVIVGSGPEENSLKRLVKKSTLTAQVSIIAWTDDVASYMRSADIFALSSYHEGWGRVIIEAMSAGVPCVVTDVGCVGEVFLDGQHGIVVPVNDEVAMANALAQLIADPRLRRKYGEAAARDSATFLAQQQPYATAWRATIEGI